MNTQDFIPFEDYNFDNIYFINKDENFNIPQQPEVLESDTDSSVAENDQNAPHGQKISKVVEEHAKLHLGIMTMS